MLDLPQPDSPASPNTSFGQMSNDTLSTARTTPRLVRYSTTTSRADNIGLLASHAGAAAVCFCANTLAPFTPQTWVGNLINGVIDQRQAEAHERNTDPRRDKRPPRPGQQRPVILRPVEDRTPRHAVRIAQTNKFVGSLSENGIQHRADPARHDQRDHVRQDLSGNNAPRGLTGHPRRRDKFAVAER